MRERDVVWARWDEVDRVFKRVLEAPEAERLALLARLTEGDDELRDAVADLVRLGETEGTRGSGPGEALVREACATIPPERSDALAPGSRVGRYHILGVLGRGGMATVYDAERSDGVYRQSVALKVLRRGLDTDQIVARFLAERQILSNFAHPHIARLLDGGATPDGRPFLVMEKVEGRPITEWADECEATIPERSRLFLQVADAVQESHRRLVVHRDLKPSNVLVDASSRAKLLDFGIAKLIDPDADDDLTRLGAHPLTRRYASPEQMRGEAVTTSSDVFQLGLLLYELLVGERPFQAPPGEERPVRAPTPAESLARLGADRRKELAHARGTTAAGLRRTLEGDLTTVLTRALEEDPLERYRSVEDFARDVQLYLDGRPIRARPASAGLRLRKWIGRNPWAPPIAAVLTLLVIGYLATITVSARRLEAERNEAREQAARAERMKGFLVDLFRSADPWEGTEPATGTDVTVVEALEDAADRIEAELRGEPAMQADLLVSVGSILANLDRHDEGRPFVERALELRRQNGFAETPSGAADLQILAQTLLESDVDSALVLRERAVEILRATVPDDDPRLADALSGLWGLRVRQGSVDDPTIGEEALAIYDRHGEAYRVDAAAVLSTIAQAHANAGRLDAAEASSREALARMREALGPDHPRLAVTGAILAGVLDEQQRFDEAIPIYRESLRVMEQAMGPMHHQTLATRNNLATTFQRVGRLDEAVVMHRELLEARIQRAGTDVDPSVAGSLQNLAAALTDLGQLDEADSVASRASEIYEQTTPPGHPSRALPLLTRTEILLLGGAYPEAERVAGRALAILEPALPPGHYAIGVARCRLGAALAGQGRGAEAASWVPAALELLRADERTPAEYVQECAELAERLPDLRP